MINTCEMIYVSIPFAFVTAKRLHRTAQNLRLFIVVYVVVITIIIDNPENWR